jgi:hypothetical protein
MTTAIEPLSFDSDTSFKDLVETIRYVIIPGQFLILELRILTPADHPASQQVRRRAREDWLANFGPDKKK